MNNFFKFNKIYNLEYLLASLFFFYSLSVFFFANNIFTFIIFLEFQSVCLLYFLSTNISWPSKKSLFSLPNSFLVQYPQGYLNSILFNYWASFFGSILLVFSIININKIFGSLNWNYVNILALSWSNQIFYGSFLYLFFFWFPFFFGFLVKLSYIPVHLWKPDMYKGLSFLSVLFFMTVYFFTLFLIFLLIFFNYLFSFINVWYIYIFICTSFMTMAIIYSIFDLTTIKPFLAYGTLIHLTFMLLGINCDI